MTSEGADSPAAEARGVRFSALRRNKAPVLMYILETGNLYGTERMALATMSSLDGYSRRIVFANRPDIHGKGSVLEAALKAGFEAVEYQGRQALAKILLPYFLRNRRIDIIGTGVGGAFVCHALALLTFVRLRQVVVAHGGVEDSIVYGTKHRLRRIGVRTIAVSDFVRDELVRWGVRPDTVSVVENFLSEEQRRECRERPPYDIARPDARPLCAERVKVLVMSRAHPIKRLDLIVEAVERFGLKNFDFDIYGAGESLEALKARSARFSNIRFHGFAPNAKEHLAEADLLLHTCPVEPFGLVVLEAAVSKVVAIVPHSGGAGSLVDDGHTGLCFRADQADDLERVLQAVRSMAGATLQQLVDQGKVAVERRFTPEVGTRRYREALDAPVRVRR